MEKLRIILADCNYDYLSLLEFKFVEALGNEIDLEIITDSQYFRKLFLQPQSADVLVVSEELYSPNLQRHNINNIFLLVEENSREEVKELGVTNLYKYKNIKEIYNCILSMGTLGKNIEGKKGKTEVVLVYSPIGGSGTTTLALGMSACFEQNYKKVLYINAERLNTFQQYFENSESIPIRLYGEFMYPKEDLYDKIKSIIKTEGFDYFPAFHLALPSIGIEYSIYGKIINSVKESGDYDLIIVDSDVVFDEEKANLIAQADKVVLTMNQDKKSVYVMNMLMKNMNCLDHEKYIIICNDYDSRKSNMLISDRFEKNFVVTDYVKHFEDYETVSIKELAKQADIKKITFLIS